MGEATIDKIVRLCMVCDHVQDGAEWIHKKLYEEINKKPVYSHGVCNDENCQNAFEAYAIGDFKTAVELKKKTR